MEFSPDHQLIRKIIDATCPSDLVDMGEANTRTKELGQTSPYTLLSSHARVAGEGSDDAMERAMSLLFGYKWWQSHRYINNHMIAALDHALSLMQQSIVDHVGKQSASDVMFGVPGPTREQAVEFDKACSNAKRILSTIEGMYLD